MYVGWCSWLADIHTNNDDDGVGGDVAAVSFVHDLGTHGNFPLTCVSIDELFLL